MPQWSRPRRTRSTSTVQAQVSIEPPKRVDSGWLIRVRVLNRSRAGSFAADLTGVAGTRPPASHLPLPLGWRNRDKTARLELGQGASELVRVAAVQTHHSVPILALLTANGADASATRFAWPDAQPVVLSLAVRDDTDGRVIAEKYLKVAFDANQRDRAPVVEFSDAAEFSTARQAANTPAPRAPAPTAESFAPTGRDVGEAAGAAAPVAPPIDLEPRAMSSADAQYLQDVLRCSECGATYETSPAEVVCTGCGTRYPVVDGIPILNKETTIGTLLEETDYDAVVGVTEKIIDRVGTDWTNIIAELGIDPVSVLEIGSGTGVLTRGLLQQKSVGSLTATDVSFKFAGTLARHCDSYDTPVTFVVCDANEAHFRPEAFDVVVGRSILHHLLHYEETLRQCQSVLKPGGAAIFFEPILQGKIFLTLLMGLVLRCDEESGDPQLTPIEVGRMRRLMGHHMKSKVYPQDYDSLSRLEDKYVFDIDELRRVGKDVGFREVDFLNSGEVNPSYWPQLWWTLRTLDIPPEKVTRYHWIGQELANTYGRMFADRLASPMAYFVFRK